MQELSKRTDAVRYLETVIEKMHGIKVKAIFTMDSPSWSYIIGTRRYMQCDDVFILFENNICLVISYLFVDCLEMELRALNDEEMQCYHDMLESSGLDFFHSSDDIHCNHLSSEIERTEAIDLAYADIKAVTVKPVTAKYEKWQNHCTIDCVKPTEETFKDITFIMSNNKSFSIAPAPAHCDGYVYIWSDDANCSITEYG